MATARKRATRGKVKSADKPLARYRSMRDFKVTAEPDGETVRQAGNEGSLLFVIQKHAATRLHYDFRLGWQGMLKSWAVTKGPSYFPGDKRLAVQVEDHPTEYAGFEGIIPNGQYGGGTVMLWDRGTWEPLLDVEEGLKKGSLKFALHGEKMKGNWALVRMAPRLGERIDKPNWLLIKERDTEERAQNEKPITDEAPNSVLSGRDLDAIAKAHDRVWQSNHVEPNGAVHPAVAGHQKNVNPKTLRKQGVPDRLKELRGASKEPMREFVAPQLATLAKAPPTGEGWLHEIKFDGYRIQIRIDGARQKVALMTRTGLDWTQRLKVLADAALQLPVKSALIDGEVVVLSPDGTSSFAELQAAFQEGAKHTLTYFAFDLLHLDGHNLRNLPLTQRKKLLREVLSSVEDDGTIRMSEPIAGEAAQIFRRACELGTEGIISKLGDGKYFSGRGGSWLKSKCYQEQELVIGGFTLPTNGIHGVGALLLGYYKGGDLVYAGRTGTGFTQKTHRILRDLLEKIRSAKRTYAKVPVGAGKGAIWVKPELVAQVSFSNWTADQLVRQASFRGLREDKPAKAVVREDPQSVSSKQAGKDLAPAPAHKSTAAKTRSNRDSDSKTVSIKLTHPDKVLDEESGITKNQLARYYMEVAEHMLPYIEDRPLTLVRCVDGSGKPCFYQKHKNQMLSGAFNGIDVVNRKTGEKEPYITVSSTEAIVQMAQIGVLEVHPWGSRNETMEQPDRIIIDLDPGEAIDWKTLRTSALEVRKRFKAMGLKSFVKTTGGKGLHVVVPIRPEQKWPEVKQFTHDFVLAMEKASPKLFLTKMTKAARVGKIYLDYLRNDRGATAVAPFSPRARAGLPIAMPLSWSELNADRLPCFTVSDIKQWRKRLTRDPWKEMFGIGQRLPQP